MLRRIIRKLPGKIISLIPKPEPALVQGFESRSKVGDICKEHGYSRVILVTDTTLYALELHEIICRSLQEACIQYTVYSGISSEPDIRIIDEGRKKAESIDAQCIIALGGGSVMDASKMIAAGGRLKHLATRRMLLKFLPVPGGTLPMINIPSTAGTGAELTVGAVISAKNSKRSTVIIGLNVNCVILDSSLSIGAPGMMAAACGIDALSHGLEGVVADIRVSDEDMRKSMECVKLVLENLPHVLSGASSPESGEAMCLAAHYGGNAINKQLAGYVHAFAHSIGGRYHIPHGRAIAMCLMPVMEMQKDACLTRLVKLAEYCGLGNGMNESGKADALLEAVSNLIDLCGFDKMPGMIPDRDIKPLTRMICLDSINYSAPITLSRRQIRQLLNTIQRNNDGK